MGLRALLRAIGIAGALSLATITAATAQQQIIDGYNAYNGAINAGDQATADAVLAQLTADCGALGYGDVNACVQAAVNGATQAEAPPTAEAPAGPTPEELNAQFQQEIGPVIQDFNNAYDSANGGGDYDQAQATANDAISRMGQICANYGRGDVASCVGQLPELPRPQPQGPTQEELDNQFAQESTAPLADYQSAFDFAAGGGDYNEAVARANDAAGRLAQLCANYGRATDPVNCVGFELPPIPQPAVGPSPEELAQQQFASDAKQAFDDYNGAIAQVEAGADYDAWKDGADEAASRLLQLCNNNGYGTIVECIQQELPAFPERPQTAEGGADAGTPTADTAAIEQRFTDAVGVYQNNLSTAQAGDATAIQLVNDARAAMIQACADLGKSLFDCVGAESIPEVTAPTFAETPPTPEGGGQVVDTAAIQQRLAEAAATFETNFQMAQTGDATAVQLVTDARAAMMQACADLGKSLPDCVGAESIPEITPPPSQTADGAPAQLPKTQVELQDDLMTAVADYSTAADAAKAGQGEFEVLRQQAADARARAAEACTAMGVPDLNACSGSGTFDWFPSEPVQTAAGAPAAEAADTDANRAIVEADLKNEVAALEAALPGVGTGDTQAIAAGIQAQRNIVGLCNVLGKSLKDCIGVAEMPIPESALDGVPVPSGTGEPDAQLAGTPGETTTDTGADGVGQSVQINSQYKLQLEYLVGEYNGFAEDPNVDASEMLRSITAVCVLINIPDLDACVAAAGLELKPDVYAFDPDLQARRAAAAVDEYPAYMAAYSLYSTGQLSQEDWDKANASFSATCAGLGLNDRVCYITLRDLAQPAVEDPAAGAPAETIAGVEVDPGFVTGADAADIAQLRPLITAFNTNMDNPAPGFDSVADISKIQATCDSAGLGDVETCASTAGIRISTVGRGTDTPELRTQLSTAFTAYKAAVAQAMAGEDYASAKAAADQTGAEVVRICQTMGRPLLGYCIGQPTLPLFPPPTSAQVAANTPENPSAALERQVTASFNAYMAAYNSLQAGDSSVWPTARTAMLSLEQACTALNYPSVKACTQIDVPTLPADPLAQAKNNFAQAYAGYAEQVADYRLYAETSDAPLKAPFLLQQMTDACSAMGNADLNSCVSAMGYLPLEPLPAAQVAGNAAAPGEIGSQSATVQISPATPKSTTILAGTIDDNGNLVQQTRSCNANGACTETVEVPAKAAELGRVASLVDRHNAAINDPSFDRDLAILELSNLCDQTGLGDLSTCVAQTGRTLWPKSTPSGSTALDGNAPGVAGGTAPPANAVTATPALMEAINQYVPAYAAARGGDESVRAALDAARVAMASECGQLGFNDIDACMTAVGVTLPSADPGPVTPRNFTPAELEAGYQTRLALETYDRAIEAIIKNGDFSQARVARSALLSFQQNCPLMTDSPSEAECLAQMGLTLRPLSVDAARPAMQLARAQFDTAAAAYGAGDDSKGAARNEAVTGMGALCDLVGDPNLDTCQSTYGFGAVALPEFGSTAGPTVAQTDVMAEALRRVAVLADEFNSNINDPNFDALLAKVRLNDLCNQSGIGELTTCVAKTGRVLADPRAATADPRDKVGSAVAVNAPLSDDERARLERIIRIAPQGYLDAVNGLSIGGDYAVAKDTADAHLAELNDACARLGKPDLAVCIPGTVLPPFPEPGTAVANVPTAGSPRFEPIWPAYTAYRQSVLDLSISDTPERRTLLIDRRTELSRACQTANFGAIVEECLATVGLPALPLPDLSTTVAAAPPAAPSLSDDERARLLRITRIAPDGYLSAINGLSIGGDYAVARDTAMTQLAELNDACAKLGMPALADCIPGVVLPPFPEPGTAVANVPIAASPLDRVKPAYDAYRQSVVDLSISDTPERRTLLIDRRKQLSLACQTENFGAIVEECVVLLGLPTLPVPNLSTTVAAAPPSTPSLSDDERARLLRITRIAPDGYLSAINSLSIAGDYAVARDTAMTQLAELNDACAKLGMPALADCIPGVVLPPFPEPGTAVANVPAAGSPIDRVRPAYDAYRQTVVDLSISDTPERRAVLIEARTQLSYACQNESLGGMVEECVAQLGLPTLPVPNMSTAVAGGTGLEPEDSRLGVALDKTLPDFDRQTAIRDAVAQYNEAARDPMRMAHRDVIEVACGLPLSNDFDRELLYIKCVSALGLTLEPELYSVPTDDERLKLQGAASEAFASYTNAVNQAASGDYNDASIKATEAQLKLQAACSRLGVSVNVCIAGDLPKFPPPPVTQVATALDAAAKDKLARERRAALREALDAYESARIDALSGVDYASVRYNADVALAALERVCAALEETMEQCIGGPLKPFPADPGKTITLAGTVPGTVTPGVTPLLGKMDPKVLANLTMMVGDYNALAAAGTKLDVDALTREMTAYCAANGQGTLKECLAAAGLLLADKSVSGETKEVVAGADPTTAAPLFDSIKVVEGTPVVPKTTTNPTATAPTTTIPKLPTPFVNKPLVAAPTTDKVAQTGLGNVNIGSILGELGVTIDKGTLTIDFSAPNIGTPMGAAPKGDGFVVKLGGQITISNPQGERNRLFNPGSDKISYEGLSGGLVRETIKRPTGSSLVTIRKPDGGVTRRSRIEPDGRELVLAAGRIGDEGATWSDAGDGLPPLRLAIDPEDYVLDADEAGEDDLAFFLVQPPVENVARLYSLDEVKRSARVRDGVRRLEIGSLSFASGSSDLKGNETGALAEIADAMLELLERNPAETFLIEGHTDAVGNDTSNLALSDDRALEIARILSEDFDVPPENLATQGYGETFLKVKTEKSEPANRRVTIRRITPLITVASAR